MTEFFNARYSGWCCYEHCHKRNVIELGDGCLYYQDVLMHFVCARAAQREDAA